MRLRSELPREIRRVDHAWIPLGDGTRLAARIWMPADAERALSVADEPARPPARSELDAIFTATVDATEEAVLNSLWAAHDIAGFQGRSFAALPQDRVLELLHDHGRLAR